MNLLGFNNDKDKIEQLIHLVPNKPYGATNRKMRINKYKAKDGHYYPNQEKSTDCQKK